MATLVAGRASTSAVQEHFAAWAERYPAIAGEIRQSSRHLPGFRVTRPRPTQTAIRRSAGPPACWQFA
ncbi:MAG TPA: hypothetical protein VGS19_25290 [Streptosporangiaceae bacterium]|nr:hypothetical protein [Streptosporangiaceae bacterium]